MMSDEESIFLQSNQDDDQDLEPILLLSRKEQQQVLRKQEDERRSFEASMASQGIDVVVVPMPADGECLLRAFSVVPFFVQMTLSAIRGLCIQRLDKQFLHRDPEELACLIGMSYADDGRPVSSMTYREEMSQDGRSCDALMFNALQYIARVDVTVYRRRTDGGFEKVVYSCDTGGAGTDCDSKGPPVSAADVSDPGMHYLTCSSSSLFTLKPQKKRYKGNNPKHPH
jgi:hypothetical protein